MSENITIPHTQYADYPALMPPAELAAMQRYARRDPDGFWLQQARRVHWHRKPRRGFTGSFTDNVSISWFEDGLLNASVCCIDKHLTDKADQVALISHREGRAEAEKITYAMLHERVCRLSNALVHLGVEEGHRVAICLPMISEAVVAMLACARIGAVHVVLFGGFSAEGIAERIIDSGAVAVITASESMRGNKIVPFKAIMDEALCKAGAESGVRAVLVVRTSDAPVPMLPGRDYDFHDFVDSFEADFVPVVMRAEAPLFMLYTSGSTGKPKAVVHATGGYMVWAAYTMGMVYHHQPGDVLWCTADVAWITGHTSVVYGPLANGGTTMISDSLPSYPAPGRWLDLIDEHKVTMLFTAPTAVRAMMADGDDVVNARKLDSLRLLGVAGEPISPDAWLWYHDVVGKKRCPVVDTWWQTETAGIVLGPLPGVQPLKPGSASTPLPGLEMVIADTQGRPVQGPAEGSLCIACSWPGQARTIWKDHARFCQTYFSMVPGHYFTGDGARRDADGYYWITGRMDDVINIAGHRLGTAEVEDALAADHRIVESAAVGIPHPVKGQALAVFVIQRQNVATQLTEKGISRLISGMLGRYATPEAVYLVPDLPRTRSGKIVRRLLRKIASGEVENLGDLSSLNDPSIVRMLSDRVWSHMAFDEDSTSRTQARA
ncbi:MULTISPECIES: acetate--CoA ligase [Acetobacter]|uniref:Acetate--CoA ligase n=2 Tax=Acetobacter TaxID=434 RepID=A0AAN1UA47_9PROT|nr:MULTISPECIES: acetate--CoA ligase [Acetobacter]ASL39366.1 acetate--CoA ligase [Acetobacter oryzifermentans]AXN01493.1 acetate--CoA ligase [Acetobacter pomorum]KAA8397115.1 acetate--CoA ligase [Acetobacter sp. DmW_125124]KAA8397662.1 acetate--CoA ligase [Acetobacter sp. DmW_125127]KAA8401063.1 acetate--CoA ligase [Acetobacter sp. DmW_125128]